MAIKETIQVGHPSLKAVNSEIKDFDSNELKQLIQDLKDTMINKSLIGIAAPQIAENFKVFITQPRKTESRSDIITDDLRIYINPKIIYYSSEEVIIYEGCGCINDIFGPVSRPKEITVEALDEKGERFQIRTDGILARVIQHEYDHLNGIEFTQKVCDYTKLMNKEFYIQDIRNSSPQLEASKITIKEHRLLK